MVRVITKAARDLRPPKARVRRRLIGQSEKLSTIAHNSAEKNGRSTTKLPTSRKVRTAKPIVRSERAARWGSFCSARRAIGALIQVREKDHRGTGLGAIAPDFDGGRLLPRGDVVGALQCGVDPSPPLPVLGAVGCGDFEIEGFPV